MAKATESFTPSVRKVEKEIGETGVGQVPRVETTYEFGFEVDGAWVPVTSVPGNRVDRFVEKAKAAKQAAKASGKSDDDAGA